MNPIDRSATNGTAFRPTAAAPVAATVAATPQETRSAPAAKAASGVATGITPPSAGEAAPVDADRVSVIRKAIEQGRYPVVPTRIADAMIAAGFLLRTKE